MKKEFYKPILINDHFQNYKPYSVPKAQLIIADIPYNLGNNAYASNPAWYKDGDNNNGESDLAGKSFFDTDENFRISEFLHFCSTMLVKEPKEAGKSPCMIVFCEFEQQFELITKAKKYGLNNYINLVFRKNFSAQVLKANMKVVGNCEYAVILYRDKLPKFNNNGKMIFNCMDWIRDNTTEKVHPTQKPVKVLEHLIRVFTDEGDVVIDPCAGSGSTLLAACQTNRRGYGFEIKKDFFKLAKERVLSKIQKSLFLIPLFLLFSCTPIVKKKEYKHIGFDRVGNTLTLHPDSFFIFVRWDEKIPVTEKEYHTINIGDTLKNYDNFLFK
jgi:site-specific DNA-methyltransferase (adenine-specific)